jgi:hypothetical protein
MKSSIILMVLVGAVSIARADAACEIKAGTAVENRELQGAADSFKKGDTVFAWSSTTGAEGTKVAHVWKLDGKEVFKYAFDVKSGRWRSNSRRRSVQAGAWTVECQTEDGNKLSEVGFKVE